MKYLRVKMQDGSEYDIPVSIIAENRASNYVDEFNGDLQRSLNEDTNPLFESDSYEIEDWAANNMNWSDVENVAVKLIAAAPELLEALIKARKFMDRLPSDWFSEVTTMSIEYSIDKATGKTWDEIKELL